MTDCGCAHPAYAKLTDTPETIVCRECGGLAYVIVHTVEQLRHVHKLFVEAAPARLEVIDDE